MVLVMKLASGHVAMLKMNVANQRSQVAALHQLQKRAVLSKGDKNHKSLSSMTGDRLSGNLELLRAQKSDNPHLAVMLVWLAAKRAHLEDYFRFYLDNGFDVLWVRTHPKQFMFPASKDGSQKVSKDVLDFLLAEKNRCYQNMMLHSFSMGGYQWGECLVQMKEDQEKEEHVRKILKAQVYDSCVSLPGLANAVPKALTRDPVLQAMGKFAIQTYLGLAYPFATRHYQRSSDHFRYSPMPVPGLYFNSLKDKVNCLKTDAEIVSHWQELGADVKRVTFDDSPHVQHLRKHPDIYTGELVDLMNRTIPGRGDFSASQLLEDIEERQRNPPKALRNKQ